MKCNLGTASKNRKSKSAPF